MHRNVSLGSIDDVRRTHSKVGQIFSNDLTSHSSSFFPSGYSGG